jgi:hypothetical protein
MVEAKLLRKKLKNGLIVDKWDLVTIIEKQQAEIEALKHWQDTWRPFLKKHFGVCNGFCGEHECKENQDVCKRKAQGK